MKRVLAYVCCLGIGAIALWYPFSRGSVDIDIQQLQKSLQPYVKEMEAMDHNWIRKQYHISGNDCEQMLVYASSSAMEVDEIAVFKQSDNTKREQIRTWCEKRIQQQLSNFQGYAPKQSALLETAAVYEDGRYVVVLVHPQQSQLRRLLAKAW